MAGPKLFLRSLLFNFQKMTWASSKSHLRDFSQNPDIRWFVGLTFGTTFTAHGYYSVYNMGKLKERERLWTLKNDRVRILANLPLAVTDADGAQARGG